MENPATWGRAEHIVQEAYQEWFVNASQGMIGLSLARCVTDALRKAGLLLDEVGQLQANREERRAAALERLREQAATSESARRLLAKLEDDEPDPVG